MSYIVLVENFLENDELHNLDLLINNDELDDIKKIITKNNGFCLTPKQLSPYYSLETLMNNSKKYSNFNIGLTYRYNFTKDSYNIKIIKR